MTETIWITCIAKGMFTKTNISILEIMILFMGSTQMCAYCDANWANNMDDYKYTSNYVFLLGNGDIKTWSSKTWTSIVMSLTKAEYMIAS